MRCCGIRSASEDRPAWCVGSGAFSLIDQAPGAGVLADLRAGGFGEAVVGRDLGGGDFFTFTLRVAARYRKNKPHFSSSPRWMSSRSPRYRHEILLNSSAIARQSPFFTPVFRPIPAFRPTAAVPLQLRAAPRVDLFPWGQLNSTACGGARHSGKRVGFAPAAFSFRWVRIFSMTIGSSMQAMIFTAPPQ